MYKKKERKKEIHPPLLPCSPSLIPLPIAPSWLGQPQLEDTNNLGRLGWACGGQREGAWVVAWGLASQLPGVLTAVGLG